MANLKIIKEIADRKKIPIGKVADAAGIEYQTLNKAIRKGTTSLETLEKVAEFLGVSPSVFWQSEPEPMMVEDQSAEYSRCPECVRNQKTIDHLNDMISDLQKKLKDLGYESESKRGVG